MQKSPPGQPYDDDSQRGKTSKKEVTVPAKKAPHRVKVPVGEPWDDVEVHIGPQSEMRRMGMLSMTLASVLAMLAIALVVGFYRGNDELVGRVVNTATATLTTVVGYLIGRTQRVRL